MGRKGLGVASHLGPSYACTARLAQLVEHETLNLRVVGSSPTSGEPSILGIPVSCPGFQHLRVLFGDIFPRKETQNPSLLIL